MEFLPNNPFDEIIENLYLGDYDASLDIPKLKEKGIKKVLTISDYKMVQNMNLVNLSIKELILPTMVLKILFNILENV